MNRSSNNFIDSLLFAGILPNYVLLSIANKSSYFIDLNEPHNAD